MAVIDAVLNGQGRFGGKAYFFHGDHYLRYDWGQDRADSGPMLTKAWDLPDVFRLRIDAAVNGRGIYEGMTLFIKDDEFVVFDWKQDTIVSLPAKIASGLNLPPEYANGINAALDGQRQHAGKTLFFKDNKYIRYDWEQDLVDLGPLLLTDWDLPVGFVDGIDAALNGQGRFAGKAYFFKGDQYVRYDWKQGKVEYAPARIARYWTGLGMLATLLNIDASVGVGGVNNPADVKTIQTLLNQVAPELGGPTPPLSVDGLIGPKTTAAIRQFQLFYLGFQDGRIDLAGPTLLQLSDLVGLIAELTPTPLPSLALAGAEDIPDGIGEIDEASEIP